jgi:hypothetical protein
MTHSILARVAACAVAMFITLALVDSIAGYAYAARTNAAMTLALASASR